MTITSYYSLLYYYVFPLILTNSFSFIMNLGHVLKFHLELKAQCHSMDFFEIFFLKVAIKVKIN